MIRKLALTVVAVFGLTAVTKAQGQLPTLSTTNVSLYDDPDTGAPTWKMRAGGNYTIPYIPSPPTKSWSVTNIQIIAIPSDGGKSLSMDAGDGSGQYAWYKVWDYPLPPNVVYNVFVIATAQLNDSTPGVEPVMTDIYSTAGSYSSLQQVQRGPNTYNNTSPAIATCGTISATTARANGIMSCTISATNGGNYQPPGGQTASLLIDLNVKPTMVILPRNGGKFYRVVGQWTGPPNNGVYSGSANSDPANGVTLGDQTQQYWVYQHCTTQRFMNGAATPTETQITCSQFVLK